MKILKHMANAVRTYGLVDCGLGEKFLLAAKRARVKLLLGMWLSDDEGVNAQEIEELGRLRAQGLRRVIGLVVGSEVLWRGDLTMNRLIEYINQVRGMVPEIPVTTAEPWHIWAGLDNRYPDPTPLVEAVDFIFPNIHPYWEGICLDQAVNAVFERLGIVQEAYPAKKAVISETGWPTNGEPSECAIPSPRNQRRFLKRFLCRAQKAKIDFYYFEGFDEKWKAPPEVEAHWGFYDSDRTPKHPFDTLRRCPKR